MARKPWGSPAQKAALNKARKVAAARKRSRPKKSKRYRNGTPADRGINVPGLKKNFIPYARVNKRSQTVGYNAGTVIGGTNKRIVVGSYVRLENIHKKGAIDKAFGKGAEFIAPKGSKRGAVRSYLKQNVTVTNPAVRAKVPGFGEARLSTSRGGGPTITVRRGHHKTPLRASRAGIKKFDGRTSIIERQRKRAKKPRRERRGKNSK